VRVTLLIGNISVLRIGDVGGVLLSPLAGDTFPVKRGCSPDVPILEQQRLSSGAGGERTQGRASAQRVMRLRPATWSKWASRLNSTAPHSTELAAIQRSLVGIGCQQACLLDRHAAAIQEEAQLLPVLRLTGAAGKATEQLRQHHGSHQQLLRPLKDLDAIRIATFEAGVGVGSTCFNGVMAAAKASASARVQVPARRCNTRRFTLMPYRRASCLRYAS
jgi:hypothetical protein